MKKLGTYFVALLLIFSFLRSAAAAENLDGSAASRHPLWVVAGKSNVVYLLGSVHLLKPEHYPLAAPILAAFTNARIAVFETDLDNMEDPAIQLKLMSKAQFPEGETLRQQLSAGTYASFTNRLAAAGLPAEMFDQFKPFIAAMTLEMLELQKLGADPEFGVDKYFFKRAQKDGKQIMPLETVDFQIDLITSFSKAEGEVAMKSTLKEIDDTKKQYGEMIAAWQHGDAMSLEKLLNDAVRETPAIYKRFLTDRSERWVPKIQELLNGNQNAIVIVGAGHLVGTNGVVELLKRKNLKVTQL